MELDTPRAVQMDAMLVRNLELRDGRLPERPPSHQRYGGCKYVSIYAEGECPWCNHRGTSRQ
jgi:hypothetical protein